jgi:hypothetical protein
MVDLLIIVPAIVVIMIVIGAIAITRKKAVVPANRIGSSFTYFLNDIFNNLIIGSIRIW